MADQDGVAKVVELVKAARIAMLTTIDEDGRLVARPMGVQEVEFDGDLWFFLADDSPKAHQIQANPQVNVSFSDGSAWTSIAGRAELVHDRTKAEELWNTFLDAWFEDGLDTPNLALVKVHADTAEYWDTPGSTVVTLLAVAKAKLTGSKYEGAGTENEVVDLP